ncbi:MAG: response regulator [Sulfurimonas sp.]|nr:response regulator [Sulfurimonas sp.]
MENSKYKILIVDDVEDNLRLVSSVLKQQNYQVGTAKDGLTALRLVNEEIYDLILLDVMMPIMGGFETCRYLKVAPETASIPVIFCTASYDKGSLLKAYQVGGVDYIKKPFLKEELLVRVHIHLKLKDYEKNLENKVLEKTKEISDTQIKLMYTLGAIAEGHSKETQLHVERVSKFTYLLSKLYGMKEEEAVMLKNASALHDIGKLGITDSILHKNGKLTNSEFKEIKKHAELGREMLGHSQLPLLRSATIVAGEHHGKWDGSGYPNRLKGNEIHIYGRIVALADVFDALSFKRAYKDGWTQSEVLEFIKDMRGKHFDPQLVDLFFDNIDDFLKIYNQQLEKQKKVIKTKMNRMSEWLFQEL